MIKRYFLIVIFLFTVSFAYSQTDDIKLLNIKNPNSEFIDYSKLSLDKSSNRKFMIDDTILSKYKSSDFKNGNKLLFDSAYVPKKNYLIPVGEVISLNIFVWSLSRYIVPAPWARISINSIKENWKHQWVWDSDHFRTNQLGHPYHGNLFFNFARSSGLSFWESAPYSLAGSFMWEMCMEINYPSRNDLITTTMGGIALGEMTYRLSSKILDERTTGSERVWREIGAFLLAPTRGVNRLFRGEMSRVKQKSSYEIEDVYSSISLGPAFFYKPGEINKANGNVAFRLDLYYGKPFEEKARKPYDFFNVKAIFNVGTQPKVNQVSVIGYLFGKNIKQSSDKKMLIGLFQHFDYYSNTSYEIFGQSIGPGIVYKIPTRSGVEFEALFHFAGIALGGGSNIKEAFKYEADGTAYRDYNFSVGFTNKFETLMNIKKTAYFFLGIYDFQYYTEDGADGTDNLLMFNPRFAIAITPTLYIGTDYNLYHRISKYDKYGTFKTTVNQLKFFISNSF
jgi:hypothetical protein